MTSIRAPPPGRLPADDRAAMPLDDPGSDRQPETGAAGRRVRRSPEPLEDVRQVGLAEARAAVLDDEVGVSRRRGWTAISTVDPVGAWRTALSPRIRTSWRSRSASAVSGTGSASTSTRTSRSAAIVARPGRRVERDLAEVGRRERQVERPRIGPREQQQVVDERAEPDHLVVDAVERGRARRRVPIRLAAQLFDRAADDRQRRAQLVAGVGGEIALASEGVTDRDERPVGIDPADAERRGEDEQAAGDQHGQQDRQRPDLVRPVADDLDDEDAVGPLDRRGQDADRVAPRRRRSR